MTYQLLVKLLNNITKASSLINQGLNKLDSHPSREVAKQNTLSVQSLKTKHDRIQEAIISMQNNGFDLKTMEKKIQHYKQVLDEI